MISRLFLEIRRVLVRTECFLTVREGYVIDPATWHPLVPTEEERPVLTAIERAHCRQIVWDDLLLPFKEYLGHYSVPRRAGEPISAAKFTALRFRGLRHDFLLVLAWSNQETREPEHPIAVYATSSDPGDRDAFFRALTEYIFGLPVFTARLPAFDA